MAHISTGVEYALHSLLWLVHPSDVKPSSKDLAEIQGIPASFVAKIFPKLEKAGIVKAATGVKGGYALAKPAEDITVLDVVLAVDGKKSLFQCREIRTKCALFDNNPPEWASKGLCGINKVMLEAEAAMKKALSQSTLASLMQGVACKGMPSEFPAQAENWFSQRHESRENARVSAMRKSRTQS